MDQSGLKKPYAKNMIANCTKTIRPSWIQVVSLAAGFSPKTARIPHFIVVFLGCVANEKSSWVLSENPAHGATVFLKPGCSNVGCDGSFPHHSSSPGLTQKWDPNF